MFFFLICLNYINANYMKKITKQTVNLNFKFNESNKLNSKIITIMLIRTKKKKHDFLNKNSICYK